MKHPAPAFLVALNLLATAAPADDLFLPVAPADDRFRAAVVAASADASEYLGPTIRYRHARIDLGLLGQARALAGSGDAPAGLVDLNLFEDSSFRVAGLRTAPTSTGYSLSGELDGEPFSSVTLVVNGEVIAGEVRLPGATFTVRSAGDLVEIRQTEEEALPECMEPERPPASAVAPATTRDLAVVDLQAGAEVTGIDVLVVYTTAARDRVGGEAAMEARIDQWVAATNGFFRDSGVHQRIRLAHAEELDYEETSSSFELVALRQKGDGLMDEVHAMRDAVGADIVHLIERWGVNGTSSYCGQAYIMLDVGASFEEYAFGATAVDCGSLTFAHELGHNMGLNHDRYAEDLDLASGLGNRPSAHAYGYVNQEAFAKGAPSSRRWHTIMAYNTHCSHSGFGCSRLGRFSNPATTAWGQPLGVWRNGNSGAIMGPADAASALNESRTTAAAWRSAPSAPQVVSLKRRTPAGERTTSDSLTWRLAFSREVKNVTSDAFELSGSGLGTTTLTVAAKGGSRRIYDIAATGGVAGFDGEVTLGFASGQDIRSLSDEDLVTTWPAHAQRTYLLDNTGATPSISPSSAGSSPFVATVTFDEDVTGFSDAADVTASNATVSAPARSDARTYTVRVTPTGSTATTIALSVPAAAATDLAGNATAAGSRNVSWDPSTAASLSISGYSNSLITENAQWTSATPTIGGSPSGTVLWTTEGADADLFTIDSVTGVLRLAGQDFENPADADGGGDYEVTARATDEKGNSDTAAVTVSVTDAAEPEDVGVSQAASRKIRDGTGYRSRPFLTCGTRCRAAGGPVRPLTWEKTGADAALFTLESSGAAATLSLGARDFEAPGDADGDNDYEVTVTGTDADGNTASEDVTVRLFKGPPRWLEVSGVSAATIGHGDIWISASPSVAGASGAVNWTKEGPDADQFAIDSSGVLTIASRDHANPADANRDNVYEVRLRATDGEGNSGAVAVSVTVTDGTTSPPPGGDGSPPGGGGSPPPPEPGPDPEPEPEPDPEPDPPPPPSFRPAAAFTVEGATCDAELCRAVTGEALRFTDTSTGTVRFRRWEFSDGNTSRSGAPVHAWSSPGFHEVILEVSDGTSPSTARRTFLVTAAEPAGTCTADAETLCLQDSRYAVTVEWRDGAGGAGAGRVVHAGTNDSGLFSFFDGSNWEVLIKVLDGCAANGHVWVFGGSTTDLGYVIRVTDTATGALKEYRNEPGSPAAAITDVAAFPGGCDR